eukprot:6243766-Amphidinium_carterae.1
MEQSEHFAARRMREQDEETQRVKQYERKLNDSVTERKNSVQYLMSELERHKKKLGETLAEIIEGLEVHVEALEEHAQTLELRRHP